MLRAIEHATAKNRVIGIEVGNTQIGSSLACFALERVCCPTSTVANCQLHT